MPAKVEATPPLPGLSPVGGKPIVARFDGGQLSSDGGLLALREVEQRLGIADRLAACIDDPRAPERIRHGLADIMRFRMLMIAAGYEDGNDADSLRHDPLFKLALDRLPDGAALCSQPTISRLENLPGCARPAAHGPRHGGALLRAASARCRAASCWTSTTPSMPSMAGSSCGCSTPTTTNTASSRSSCSTARAASSPPCCARPGGRPARRRAPSCAAWCARSAATGRGSRS